jgi:membrane protease YdiL (CAAX protease family)
MQRPEEAKPKELREAAAGIGPIAAPEASEFILLGKILFCVRDLMQQAASSPGSAPPPPGSDPTVAIVSMSDSFAGWTGKDKDVPPSADNPPRLNKHPDAAADRLRAAILAGEILDKNELEWRVHDVEQSLDASSDLRQDARIVRLIYGLPPAPSEPTPAATTPTDDKKADDKTADDSPPEQDADANTPVSSTYHSPEPHAPSAADRESAQTAVAALSADAIKGFRDRHGWFADLALSRGDDKSTIRSSAASDGLLLIVFLCFIGFIILLAGFIGLILLIFAIIKHAGGNLGWAFARPHIPTEWPPHEDPAAPADVHANPFPRTIPFATPGSVWLETVAVFFIMFLGVRLLGMGLQSLVQAKHLSMSKDSLIAVTLIAQWAVLPSIFWPLLRGMPFSRWKAEIGWSAPRGVLREIGAGFCGYLAGIPVYFAMAIVVVAITFLISHLTGADEAHPAGNRLTSVLEGGSPWELFLVFTLATMWAPIVEESIFRGCLFRHLRRRMPLLLAALGSASVFAALHGYMFMQLFMVGALGFWFALMREWRGNIIATATAHAIHNGFVMTILLICLSFARG